MWLVVSERPEQRWREAREHFHYQLDLYARWTAQVSGWDVYARQTATDDELRSEGVRVVSPAQAIDIIRRYVEETPINRWYSWTLPPGLPPEWADEHIELMAKQVMPAFR
jgi:hypothetical protein